MDIQDAERLKPLKLSDIMQAACSSFKAPASVFRDSLSLIHSKGKRRGAMGERARTVLSWGLKIAPSRSLIRMTFTSTKPPRETRYSRVSLLPFFLVFTLPRVRGRACSTDLALSAYGRSPRCREIAPTYAKTLFFFL